MNEQISEFFGSVLKAIACTPNRCEDDSLYTKNVIETTRRIRALGVESASGTALPPKRISEVLGLLLTVLDTKRVDSAEIEDRLREIAQRSGLQDRFPQLRAEAEKLGRQAVSPAAG